MATQIVSESHDIKALIWKKHEAKYEDALRLSKKYAQETNKINDQEVAIPELTNDTVTISSESIERLNASKETCEMQLGNKLIDLTYNEIWSLTAKDGTKIQVGAAINSEKDKNEYQAVQVTFTSPNGDSYSEFLDKSAVVSLSEDGVWSINYPDGAETSQQNIQSSVSDDIIIVLPSGDSEYAVVDAGDGDNVILDLTSGHTKITTGQGDDKIIGLGGGSYDVISGDGDDEIYLKGDYAKVVSGDGNDKITIKNAICVDLESGGGDDSITIDSKLLYKAKISGGDGNDSIVVNSFLKDVSISGGDGDDTISINSALGIIHDVHILGGNGDDVINISSPAPFSGVIDGGAGNDTITADSMGEATIIGGDGNDHIKVDTIFSGSLQGGNGNDTIEVKATIGQANISGDDGNDTIKVGHLGARYIPNDEEYQKMKEEANANGYDISSMLYDSRSRYSSLVDGGNGDDIIEVDQLGGRSISGTGIVNGGNGNDRITVNNAYGSKANPEIIIGGDGDDTITINEGLYGGTIIGGDGDDVITVNNMVDSEIIGDSKGKKSGTEASNATPNQVENEDETDKPADGSAPVDDISKATAETDKNRSGGNDTIKVGRMEFSSIDGGGGDDTISVGVAIASGIGGGDGDDSIDVTESIASEIFGEELKWNKQAAIGQYAQYLAARNIVGDNKSITSQDMSINNTQQTEQEIFLDALMRGDKSHPRVKEILDGQKGLNTVV